MSTEEGTMDKLRISAEPADRALPTVGPWVLFCSEHGILGMADTALAADHAVAAHARSHPVTVGAGS